MKKYLAVYGSLRKGEYNYKAFEDGLNYIDTVQIKGFDLYSLGAYPCVVEGNGTLTVDLFEVTDSDTSRRIASMEIGAGYDIQPMLIQEKPCIIYTQNNKPQKGIRIEHGDWIKYKNND